jgi:putative restriction endonuclease
MAFYWVNLGDTYREVKEYNFLWAPTHTINKKGSKTINAGWKHVPNVRKNDIIFCHTDGEIIYVAVATKDSCLSPKPANRSFDKWKKKGNKIEVCLEVLTPPVRTKEFISEFISLYNSRTNPKLFTVKQTAAQQYMVSIPAGAGALILDCLGDVSINIQEKLSAIDDNNKHPVITSRTALVKARVGQGQFRDDVLGLWCSTCPITNVSKPELLIASHIVSWQLSSNEEKLDKYNGLPLAPNVDKLFDKGYISFSDKGEILVHESITTKMLNQLGIDRTKRIEGLKDKNLFYLRRHRELHGF